MQVQNHRIYGIGAPFPDPPHYRRCAAAANELRERSQQLPLSGATMKMRCQRAYRRVKDKALAFLITSKWTEGEAAARGVRLPTSKAEAMYEQMLNGPAGNVVAAHQKRDGMSKADEVLELRLEQLAQGLRSKLGSPSGAVSQAQVTAYHRRWKQRTMCRPGYVMHDCRNSTQS